MKKIISLLLVLVMVVSVFAGCGSQTAPETTAAPTEAPATEAPVAETEAPTEAAP